MALLSKSRTVMSKKHEWNGQVMFQSDNEAGPEHISSHVVTKQKYEDMGSPLEITVTIEPGNTLEAGD